MPRLRCRRSLSALSERTEALHDSHISQRPIGTDCRRLRAALTGALALALGAPAAQAAFTTSPCLGGAITGNGASFQNTAQNSLWSAPTGSFAAYCTAVGVSAPAVTYTGGG